MVAPNDPRSAPIFGLVIGSVIDDVDPSGQDRVRVTIPGIFEAPTWAKVAHLGAPYARGGHAIPKPGFDVVVGFLQGDFDHPIVLGSLAPPIAGGGIRASLAEDQRQKVVQLENEDWTVFMGPNSNGGSTLMIGSRKEPNVKITLDRDNNAIRIEGPAAIDIQSQGMVNIDAPVTQIAGRRVRRNGRPI